MSLLTKSATKDDDAGKSQADKAATKRDKAEKGDKPSGRRRATPGGASVNLLSPWVLDELHVRRLRRRFVAGGVVLLVVVAAAWALLRFDHARGQDDLAADQAVGSGLMTQIAELGDVKIYVGNVQQRANSVETTMANQIAFSDVMRALDTALPADTELTTVDVVLPPDPATTAPGTVTTDTSGTLCPGPDPFGSRPVIGCIQISGTADSRASISQLVQALGRSDLFIEPFISATTTDAGDEGGGSIEFTGSLGLDETTYMDRFADVDGSDAPAAAADPAAAVDPASTVVVPASDIPMASQDNTSKGQR